MTAFNYVALDSRGHEKKGLLEGDTSRSIRQILRDQGLTPINVIAVERQANSHKTSFWQVKQKMSVSDLALVTRQLATLLNAGLPLEEVLLAASEQTEKEKIKSTLLGVRARVLEGHALATGLSDYPHTFPEVYRASVAAGEK